MPRPTPPPQTRGAGAPRRLAILLLSLLALAALAPTPARAKVETGTLKLDSVTTEHTIAKFGTGNDGPGELVLKLTTAKRGWERGTHQLRLMLFKNRKYAKWKAAIAKGSLCDVRNRLADVTKVVDLPHPLATHSGHGFEYFEDPETGRSYRVNKDNPEDVEWRDPNNHTEGPLDRVIHRETEIRVELRHFKRQSRKARRRGDPREDKATHWFAVISDCAMENYDAHPPPMHYELNMFAADGNHLPADILGMGKLYWLIFLALAGAAPGGLWLASNQYRRLGRVHILTVMVFAAYGLQTTSVALELMHLGVYSKDGKGLQWRHTFFAADFAAETMQGASELITSLTLLFLACGWTTVTVGSVTSRLVGSLESGVGGANAATAAAAAAGGAAGLKALSGKRGGGAELGKKLRKDVPEVAAAVVKGIFTDGDGPEVKRRVGAVAGALREPARLVGVTGRAPGRSWRQSLDASSFAMFLFVFIHMYLEIASRRFTDDFSAFHDHAHWPGYCLVLLRLCVAAVFYVGGRSASRLAESQDRSTAKFLKRLDVVGLTWLLAFPFLVCTAWILTPMTRHRYVVGGVALLQCASSLGLGWLVLASEKFLSLSTVAPRSSSAANVLGARGFAAKLAVD